MASMSNRKWQVLGDFIARLTNNMAANNNGLEAEILGWVNLFSALKSEYSSLSQFLEDLNNHRRYVVQILWSNVRCDYIIWACARSSFSLYMVIWIVQ